MKKSIDEILKELKVKAIEIDRLRKKRLLDQRDQIFQRKYAHLIKTSAFPTYKERKAIKKNNDYRALFNAGFNEALNYIFPSFQLSDDDKDSEN